MKTFSVPLRRQDGGYRAYLKPYGWGWFIPDEDPDVDVVLDLEANDE